MFKNRHFMIGLGIGLITGALLLQIMLLGQGNSGDLWTQQQVIDAAAKLDLKVVSNGETLLTEEEWKLKSEESNEDEETGHSSDTDSINGSINQTDAPGTPDAPAEPNTPESAQPSQTTTDTSSVSNEAPSDASSAKAPATPEAPVVEPQKVTVEYKVVYGTTLTELAEGLHKAGVISDKDAFIKKANAKKVTTKIRTGTYYFNIGEDYTSIIAKLTAKPKY